MGEVIAIRTAGSGDIDALDTLLRLSYARLLKPDYPPSLQVMAIPVISRANPILVTSGTYYVAEAADGEIVGAGGWTRSVKGKGTADIRHFATHPNFLRRGIARRVMMGVFCEARVAGIRQLDCLATRTAVPFYRALGFDEGREVSIGLRPGIDFPVVRMGRTL